MPEALTRAERNLQLVLRILATAFFLAVFAYLLPALGVFGDTLRAFYVNLPFVTNSVVKIGTLALLAFFAAADVRRFRLLVRLLIAGHLVSELAMAAVLVWGDTSTLVTLPSPIGTLPVRNLLLGAMLLDGAILVGLILLARAADRARYQLHYFTPTQFRTLSALAEVVVMGEDERLSAEDVARNTDGYLAAFEARQKWLAALVLTAMEYYPLFTLRPPFSYLPADERLAFLKRRFYADAARGVMPAFLRMLIQAGIRMAKQLCYLGYYGDERTHSAIGYVPFSKRPDTPGKLAAHPSPARRPLRVLKPSEIDGDRISGDVVIVGSGAAASILAYNLVRAGREVLLLERGEHVDPSTFTENEADMLGRLYHDGALQLSKDFRFQVLQGSCVGGTTVVNNAVCFRIPEAVLDRWNNGLNAGLDGSRLAGSYEAVERLISAAPQRHDNLNHGAAVFTQGVQLKGWATPPDRYDVVSANIADCLGCGYCNIGCAYGRKLSMLDLVLPLAQELAGPQALRILSGCEAVKLRGRGSRIESVDCNLSDGRKLRVSGNTIVVAAGAVSSPLLLLRSSVGGPNVGQRASFNVGSPVHAAFPQVLNAYDGLQISHFLELVPNPGFVLETWYNPPVAQALAMPGWFEDHFRNMRRYDRMSAVGVLVGSEPNAVVRVAGLFGREIDWTPTAGDLTRILDGIVASGEAFFAAGAEAVLPATFAYREYRSVEELQRIRFDVQDAGEITLGTGHPMGGSALGTDPRMAVVGPDFRVFGYDNLFVCDASVFPSALGVNPQLTVMALAQYAAEGIAGAAAGARMSQAGALQPA